MPLFEDVRQRDAGTVFKGLDGLVAVAPYSTAALLKADLFDSVSGAIKPLPAAWRQLGWCSTDGIGQTREPDISETPAWGAAEPILRTVTAMSKTLTVTPLQSNKTVDELYYMASLTSVVADAQNVINWTEPDLPALVDWRLVAIARHITAAGEWYKVDQYSRASIQPNGSETWSQDDAGNVHPLMATARFDDTLGYAVEHFQGGPGFPAAAAGYGV